MLLGFAAAFLIGDMFLVVRGAKPSSIEFLFGVAGFALAHLFRMAGQLREARPDGRVCLAVAIPLVFFVLVRLHPPVLPPAASAAVCAYSILTAVSFATALATRRVFYLLGIGLVFPVEALVRRIAVGWGGAVNVAGLCTIALVPFDVNGTIHNVGCYLATFGGAVLLAARFRKGADLVWTIWFVVLVIAFALCIDLKAIPFSPYVTTTQKLLIVSFAVWSGWIVWQTR